jgi:hypothetical protein
MTWVRRQADEHHCEVPTKATGAKTGDVWECEVDAACGAQYRLTIQYGDQRDPGTWWRWALIRESSLPNAHHAARQESGSIDMRDARTGWQDR